MQKFAIPYLDRDYNVHRVHLWIHHREEEPTDDGNHAHVPEHHAASTALSRVEVSVAEVHERNAACVAHPHEEVGGIERVDATVGVVAGCDLERHHTLQSEPHIFKLFYEHRVHTHVHERHRNT